MPTEPLILREAAPPGVIVVVRLGSRTLRDEQLSQRCEVSFDRWGIHGSSVLEVPDRTNWALLARLGAMSVPYGLTYDPNEVGGDMVVESWVLAGDDEEPPRRARVVSRSDNRVWIQLELPSSVNQVA